MPHNKILTYNSRFLHIDQKFVVYNKTELRINISALFLNSTRIIDTTFHGHSAHTIIIAASSPDVLSPTQLGMVYRHSHLGHGYWRYAGAVSVRP